MYANLSTSQDKGQVNNRMTERLLSPKYLALGTAQLGLDYGVSNKTGRLPLDEARKLISRAREAGVDVLDTATSYGTAEAILGHIGIEGFRVVTKIPSLAPEHVSWSDWAVEVTESSLMRLQINRLFGLLIHTTNDWGRECDHLPACYFDGLQRIRRHGFAEKIGISVYHPVQFEQALESLSPDLIQVPANIFDWRFADSGLLDKAFNAGVEVHVRSCFLQGLLLSPINQLPDKFRRFHATFENWSQWSETQIGSKTRIEICLSHVASFPGVSRIVVGADSTRQFEEILEAVIDKRVQRAPVSLRSLEEFLINPNCWPRL
jgi:aryl-alcohol dehydrogenase-like predicted oxidoreductase